MKRTAMNMTLAVAALALAAGTVSAQTMKAEIPFAFRVGNQVMQPGEYRVRLVSNTSSSPVLSLADFDGGNTALLVATTRSEASMEWKAAGFSKLRFSCGEGPCTITGIWMGQGSTFNFPAVRGKNGEPHLAEIVLKPERAD
uniref:Intracellular proteinase inhibitor BsuPI domain-containing protein n=1 Tax=Solibacter usitatus (strain Ellin6076) TaxID=234267 RepID=Q01W58_SOLUE